MSKKLLLADASATLQKVAAICLSHTEFQLVVAKTGAEAIQLAKTAVPDVIALDTVAADSAGYETCAQIRADPDLAHLPVILLSGAAHPIDEARAAQCGASDTLQKPFDSQLLIEKVHALAGLPIPEPLPGVRAIRRPATATASAPPSAATPAAAPRPVAPVAAPSVPGARPPMPSVPPGAPGARPPMPAMSRPPTVAPGAPRPSMPPAGTPGAVRPPMTPGARPPMPSVPPGAPGARPPMPAMSRPPTVAPGAPRPSMPPAGTPGAVRPPGAPSVSGTPAHAPVAPAVRMPTPQHQPSIAPAPVAPAQQVQPAQPVAAPSQEELLRTALQSASRELIEKIAWEVVPQLAETIVREELERLIKARGGQ